jgi:hypothetical protein
MGDFYILMVCAMWLGSLLGTMLLPACGITFFLKTPKQKKRLLFWTFVIYGIAVFAYVARIIQAFTQAHSS